VCDVHGVMKNENVQRCFAPQPCRFVTHKVQCKLKAYFRHSSELMTADVYCADVTSLPGYQAIASNCPVWKRAMIEKKNRQLEEDAMV